jgi:hypothetical protein
MDTFIKHLDQESLNALSLLAASEIQFIYSPDAEIYAGQSLLSVQSISIPVGNSFIIIESDWLRTTDIDCLHHHDFWVRENSSPKGLFYNPIREPGGFNFKGDHVTLFLGARQKICKIDILTATESGANETAEYDAGLIIERADGLKIAIVRKESILGDMHIAHNSADVEKITSGLVIRHSYT